MSEMDQLKALHLKGVIDASTFIPMASELQHNQQLPNVPSGGNAAEAGPSGIEHENEADRHSDEDEMLVDESGMPYAGGEEAAAAQSSPAPSGAASGNGDSPRSLSPLPSVADTPIQ